MMYNSMRIKQVSRLMMILILFIALAVVTAQPALAKPKTPKLHRLIPEIALQDLRIGEEFTCTWMDIGYDYDCVGTNGFHSKLDGILDQGTGPDDGSALPRWARGEGWRNIAAPDTFHCVWREEFGDQTTVNYRCDYRHKRGDSTHWESDHTVRFTLREVVFVESGDRNLGRDHWLPRYRRS